MATFDNSKELIVTLKYYFEKQKRIRRNHVEWKRLNTSLKVIFQEQSPEVALPKKVFLKISQKSPENNRTRVFSNKVS